jgi:hypothetical protein
MIYFIMKRRVVPFGLIPAYRGFNPACDSPIIMVGSEFQFCSLILCQLILRMLCIEIISGYVLLTAIFMFGLRERRSFRHASHTAGVIVVMTLFFGSILLIFSRPVLIVLNYYGLDSLLW